VACFILVLFRQQEKCGRGNGEGSWPMPRCCYSDSGMPLLLCEFHLTGHNGLNFRIQLKLLVGLHILFLLHMMDISFGLGVGEGVGLLAMVRQSIVILPLRYYGLHLRKISNKRS
jgi:hypothetical protein